MDSLDTHLIDYSGIYHHFEAYYIMQKLQKITFVPFPNKLGFSSLI